MADAQADVGTNIFISKMEVDFLFSSNIFLASTRPFCSLFLPCRVQQKIESMLNTGKIGALSPERFLSFSFTLCSVLRKCVREGESRSAMTPWTHQLRPIEPTNRWFRILSLCQCGFSLLLLLSFGRHMVILSNRLKNGTSGAHYPCCLGSIHFIFVNTRENETFFYS